jgi:hypothetical protein
MPKWISIKLGRNFWSNSSADYSDHLPVLTEVRDGTTTIHNESLGCILNLANCAHVMSDAIQCRTLTALRAGTKAGLLKP